MAQGFQVFNTSGYKVVDSVDLELKGFTLQETRYLSVSNTGGYIQMTAYNGSQHTALQGLGGQLVGMRPTNTNMYPVSIACKDSDTFGGNMSISVRCYAAGSIEIAVYTALGETNYTNIVNALGANRWGVQVLNTSNQVVFDSDLFPPLVGNVLQPPNNQAYQATVPNESYVPFGLVPTATFTEIQVDEYERLIDHWCYLWQSTSYGYTIDTVFFGAESNPPGFSDGYLSPYIPQFVFLRP